MPAEFNYPANRIHKDNYITDFQQSQNVIKVPNSGTYDYFYWLNPNPVTELEYTTAEVSDTVSIDGTKETLINYFGQDILIIGVAVVDFVVRVKTPKDGNKINNVVVKVNDAVRTDYSITGDNQITFNANLTGDPDIVEVTVSTDVVTYSKLEFIKEPAILLMSGLVPLDVGGFWFIKYPVGFDITVAEQWMIGGKPFIPARAYEYAEEFTQLPISGNFSQPEITEDDVRDVWSTKVLQLLNTKYP